MSRLIRGYEKVEGYFAFIAALLLAFMVVIVSLDVLLRKFAGAPIRGAAELTEDALVWFTFFAAAWILKRESHVIVNVVVERFSAAIQAILNIIMSILAGAVCLALTIMGTQIMLETTLRGSRQVTVLELPQGPLYTIIPVGCAFLTIRFALRTAKFIGAWKAKKKIEKPIEQAVEV